MFFVPHNGCNFKLLIPYNKTHKWVISCFSWGQILLFWCSCVAVIKISESRANFYKWGICLNLFGHSWIKLGCPAQLFLPECHRAPAALGCAKREFLPSYSLFPPIMNLLGQGFVFNVFFCSSGYLNGCLSITDCLCWAQLAWWTTFLENIKCEDVSLKDMMHLTKLKIQLLI